MRKTSNDPDMETSPIEVRLEDLLLGTDAWQAETNAGGLYLPVYAANKGGDSSDKEIMWVDLDYEHPATMVTNLFDLSVSTVSDIYDEQKLIIDRKGVISDALDECNSNGDPYVTVITPDCENPWRLINEYLMSRFYLGMTRPMFLWYVYKIKEERNKIINQLLHDTEEK